MNKFNILHLSDLHISNDFLSQTLLKMISDIEHQTKNLSDIILVISGDIIDRGNYSGSNNVISFFRKLKNALNTKVIDIQVVPGNHDKVLKLENKIISEAFQNEHIQGNQDEWNTQERFFNDFIKLANQIFEIFGLNKSISNSFGVELKK
jgi:predicted MPP superfamily phosphohydrolase